MLTQTPSGLQLLAFTQRLIDLNFHTDANAYRALCAAYTTLLATQTIDDTTLARLFDTPCLTPATLLAEINAQITAPTK